MGETGPSNIHNAKQQVSYMSNEGHANGRGAVKPAELRSCPRRATLPSECYCEGQQR